MKEKIKKSKLFPICLELFIDIQYVFLNYFVTYIPIWYVRRFFYRLNGMKIGHKSRIHMGTKVISPNRIVLGNNIIINEGCFIDGRGHLSIGDNCSISVGCMIISASHHAKSETFEYYDKPVIIENNVWLGARAIILDGSTIKQKTIISAGSVFKGIAKENSIYKGVPAIFVSDRGLKNNYIIDFSPFFR